MGPAFSVFSVPSVAGFSSTLAISHCVWRDVEPGFVAGKEAFEFVDHQFEEGAPTEDARRAVGGLKDVGQRENLVIGWNRFGIEDFEAHADVAFLDAGDEGVGVDDCAPGDVDEDRIGLKQVDFTFADHSFCAARLRDGGGRDRPGAPGKAAKPCHAFNPDSKGQVPSRPQEAEGG